MKFFWRTIREIMNNTLLKIIVAGLAVLGGTSEIAEHVPAPTTQQASN